MQQKKILFEKNETWPVKAYMEDIVGKQSEMFIKGGLLELSNVLGNYVVFLYPYDVTDKMLDISKIKCVELFEGDSSFQLKRKKHICDAIRDFCHKDGGDCILGKEKICLPYDKEVALAFFASNAWMGEEPNINSHGFNFEKIETGTKERAYRYICPISGLTEWIVPIYINVKYPATEDELISINITYSKLLGVLITGQFKGSAFDGRFKPEIRSLISEEDYNQRACLLANILPEPTSNDKKVKDFFNSVNNFCRKIRQMYETGMKSDETELKQDFSLENENTVTRQRRSPEFYWEQFEFLRKRLEKTLIDLQKNAGFMEIDVFMPPCKINVNENIEKLSAFRITKDTVLNRRCIDTDENNVELKEQSLLIMRDDRWKNKFAASKAEKLFLFKEYPVDASLFCQNHRWWNEANGVEMGYAIYVFATNERKSSPLVFMIRDVSSQRLCNKHVTEKVFEAVATQFWTQWSEIYTEYIAFVNETIVSYNNHEIAQIAVGIDSRKELITPFLESLGDDKEITQKVKDFIKDMGNFSKQLILVTPLALTAFQRQPIFRRFSPYKNVILPARDVFELEAMKLGYKALIYPDKLSKEGVSKYPLMHSDPDKVYQITANLLKNAVKYSHYCSNIYLDFFVTQNKQGKTVYRLEIINYGPPAYWVSEGDVFDLGTRSDYAVLNDTTGIGFGLYLVKRFITMLKGEAHADEPVYVSDYNIPLLDTYENFKDQLDPDKQAEYKEQLAKIKLQDGGKLYDKIVVPMQQRYGILPSLIKSRNFDDFSYFKRNIREGTAKFRFWVDFPYENTN